MQQTETGGPAFPIRGNYLVIRHDSDGLTIRDYFAARVLQARLSGDNYDGPNDEAARAYRYADAMLRARGEQS